MVILSAVVVHHVKIDSVILDLFKEFRIVEKFNLASHSFSGDEVSCSAIWFDTNSFNDMLFDSFQKLGITDLAIELLCQL